MKKLMALLLALALTLGASLALADTFRMGIDPEYNPFSYRGDDGNFTGFDVEVCQAACDLLGLEMEPVPVDWDFKLNSLDAGDVDCIWSGMTILDSMKESGYVLSAPYYDSTQKLVVRADSGIASSADLAGKTVAVQLGTSGASLLEGDLADLRATFADVVMPESFLVCFQELEGNAVDAVLVDSPVAEKYVAEHDSLIILDEELGAEQYGICFRKGDDELCAKIEGAVAELVKNGTYATIAAKYESITNNLIFLNSAE